MPGSQVGQVLFTRNGTLMALPLDTRRLEPAGYAVPIAQHVAGSPDIAPNGRFLIITETSNDTSVSLALNWRAAKLK